MRFLVYANEFDVEGLIATTSTWLRQAPREDLIRRQIAAYAQVRPNLVKHADGFPAAERLAGVVRTGQPGYGFDFVAPGKASAGSRFMQALIERPDSRPLWILIWGGANTLAQALLDLRASHASSEMNALISRLRVYGIVDQDDSAAWIRKEFPTLFYVVSPTTQDEKEYSRGTWTGISGDRFYRNGPMHYQHLVENEWLSSHVINAHGPLGALYPRVAYIMEGDTPSFLGLIRNGLGWDTSPSFGGWGGRYTLYRPTGETRPIWTNNDDTRDTVVAQDGKAYTSDPATIWRWREHYQHDFAARMDWCVARSFAEANHNPRPALQSDVGREVVRLRANAGEAVSLSAQGTSDPDGDEVRLSWWIYEEAGTVKGATLSNARGLESKLDTPATSAAGTIHVILQAEDDGDPRLFSYRRAVIEVAPR